MLIMDQKVTTQDVLGELDQRRVKFATLRMRSRSLMKHIGSLAPADFTRSPWTGPARITSPGSTRTPPSG